VKSKPRTLYEEDDDTMARDHMLVAGTYAMLPEYYMDQEAGFR
jgi:hypothetical protein